MKDKPNKEEYGWRPSKHSVLDPGEWKKFNRRNQYDDDLKKWYMDHAVGKIKTLSNKSSLKVLESIPDEGSTVEDMIEATGFPQAQVSMNLMRLRHYGYVYYKSDGKYHIYERTGEVERVVEICKNFE